MKISSERHPPPPHLYHHHSHRQQHAWDEPRNLDQEPPPLAHHQNNNRNVATFQQQLKKWTRERREVQQDVAHHVSWLDDLRKELTTHCYSGGSSGENDDPNISSTADALLSPRQTARSGSSISSTNGRSILKSKKRNENFSSTIYPREV